jgi:hypothetical protein
VAALWTVLRRPLFAPKGTLWEVLQTAGGFTKLIEALSQTPPGGLRDMLAGTTAEATSPVFAEPAFTLFAPDDSAYDAVLTALRLAAEGEDAELLYRYHTLASGEYPRSTSGRHFLAQLFPAGAHELTRDVYAAFYANNFTGLQARRERTWCLAAHAPLHMCCSTPPLRTYDSRV